MSRKGRKKIPLEPKEFPDHGPGRCLYCGKRLTGRQRKYCCQSHGQKYWWATRTYEVIYWNDFKRGIKKRDLNRCQWCGEKQKDLDKPLEVHHIIPISHNGDEFDEDNCITLCRKCHREIHF